MIHYVRRAAVDKGDGIMVALRVPPAAAERLALEGGQPARDLHLTLAYLGKADDFTAEKLQALHDVVASIARESDPVEIELTGYDVFPETDDGPCLHLTVGMSQQLANLQETVAEAVSSYGMPPKGKGQINGRWVPHITLAYKESAPPPDAPPIKDLTLDELRVTMGEAEAYMALAKAEWDESKHPRDEAGRFGEGSDVEPDKSPRDGEAPAPKSAKELKGTLASGEFAILSAEKDSMDADTRAARTAELAAELRRRGYDPLPTEGHYGGNPERSFVVAGLPEDVAFEISEATSPRSPSSRRGALSTRPTDQSTRPTPTASTSPGSRRTSSPRRHSRPARS